MLESQPNGYQPYETVPDAYPEDAPKEEQREAEKRLAKHDLKVIKSMQTRSGTIMAGPSTKESDPYNRVWIRDNALVAISLKTAGESELATEITEGLLDLVEKHQDRILQVIAEGKPNSVERNVQHLHPAYKISGEELDVEWG